MTAPHSEQSANDRMLMQLLAMKSGPRSYTPEQAEFIEAVVAQRKPLPAKPLPLDDEERG